METVRFTLGNLPSCRESLSLCLGYFDGLHLGHQQLIERAVSSAFAPAVLTFEFQADSGIKHPNFITSQADKERFLAALGIRYLFVLQFDETVRALAPEEFIERILIGLNAKLLIVGEDYTFGKNAAGTAELLRAKARGRYETITVPDLRFEGEKIGTSAIIPLIEGGDMETSRALLGRYYQITGTVTEGYHFGSGRRVPTANVPLGRYVRPKNGVYATWIHIRGKVYPSMTNVGVHPTVNPLKNPVIEVNIFDFEGDVYGEEVTIVFARFIRAERKFPSVDALYAQLEQDRRTCCDALLQIQDAVKIFPFSGVGAYRFNMTVEDCGASMEEATWIAPSFECDEILCRVQREGIALYFHKDSQQLAEIDIRERSVGLLPSFIGVGTTLKEALKKDPSLQRTGLESVYRSFSGYALLFDATDVCAGIIIGEPTFFGNICFSSEERECRDRVHFEAVKEACREYLSGSTAEAVPGKLFALYPEMAQEILSQISVSDARLLVPVLRWMKREYGSFHSFQAEDRKTYEALFSLVLEKIK